MILLSPISVSADMRFSKLTVYICFKLKAAVEAMSEVEVKNFLKLILIDSISRISSETVNYLIGVLKIKGKLFKLSKMSFKFIHPV